MVMDMLPAIRVDGDEVVRITEPVIREERYLIYLNDQLLAEQIASPDQREELGAGFVICEGLAEHVEGVSVDRNEIWVEAESRLGIEREFRSGGGCGIRGVPKPVHSSLCISPEQVRRITREIESETWKKTGGVHCSVLFSDEGLVVKSCDIGRHNTVDKVVGHAELQGIDRGNCFIGCTGRQPAGMVAKSANAGIPIIVSRAASTSAGILTADQTGITLICFSRQNRFTIYTNPQRIEGIVRAVREPREDEKL
ncbi:MAG TPA: formate dehydrogenase accessory sulfurtransferase FdhD [Methanoculleus sp.]|nr:formate dehydrogenase accessory sulfurtransferase FdhD [Methanoculleus sp.]